VTAQFANGREILDIIGIGIGTDGEVLRNPPEENLHLVSRNRGYPWLVALYLSIIRARGNQIVIEGVPAELQ
jgi:maleate cis-trans isomerase